jgi:hypothetical protein
MKLMRRLAIILLIEITTLSLLVTALQVDFQSTAILLIFNTLFISITFQLHGSAILKLGLLAVGNVVGAAWNYCFHMLILSAADAFVAAQTNLKILYSISYPFLNSLWFISVWSLSLTLLRFHQKMPST